MKYLIVLSTILIHSTSIMSQVGTSVEEANSRNQILLNNGTTSNANWDQTNGNNPPSRIEILSNGGGSSTAPSKTNLTDQDRQLSQNYEDLVGGNKVIQEKCVGELKEACAGGDVKHMTLGVDSALIKMVAQAYATFGVVGDFLPLSKTVKTDAPKPEAASAETTKTDAPKAEGKKEKQDDYCKYIPAATEAIAAFSQKNTVDGLNQGGETSQKEALKKAAKGYDSKAEQAVIQTIGWYGGAGCYAILASTGVYNWDLSLGVKLAAATLLGTFYLSEKYTNEDYAKKINKIADALPGKGSCNPITENDCYCAQAENANDPHYCQAQMAKKGNFATYRTACTDSNMKIDPSCSCEKTNSCFEKFFENNGLAELQMGLGYSNSTFKPIASIAHGRLDGATLSSQSYLGNAAIAKKALQENASKFPMNNGNPLTPSQKSVADLIMSKGIPANLARLMAQNPPPQSAIDKAMAKLNGAGSYQTASYAPSGRNNILDFSGGDGLGLGGKKGEKKNGGVEDFMGKMNPKSGAQPNSKILEFAEKAQAKAPQITKSDRAIFEIISLRYQVSGRRLLQLDPSN